MLNERTDIQQAYREQKPILSLQAVKQGEYCLYYSAFYCTVKKLDIGETL